MKYFLFPLVIGLMIVAGLNLYIDPSGRWRKMDYNFTANWNNDQAWVSPLRIEERNLRLKQIELVPKPDILGIGSSRFWDVDSSMFPHGTNFYNASESGATLWDDVAMWEKIKQSGKIPKHLILCIDTWNFNKNTWQKYRWISTLPEVLAFLNDGGDKFAGSQLVRIAAIMEWFYGSFYEFSDLFSPAVLKVSLQELQIRYKTGAVKTNYITDIASRPADLPAWKNDGSFLPLKEDEQPKSFEQITEIGRNSGMGSLYMYMRDWETDATSIKLFDYLLSDTEKYGVDVLIIQPPFQHAAFSLLSNSAEYKNSPGRYSEIIQSLISAHKMTAYCDVLNPRMAGCTDTEFVDSSHTLKSCARKIMKTCLNKVPGWRADKK